MPKYFVTIVRSSDHSCELVVEAADEDEAADKAIELAQNPGWLHNWEEQENSVDYYDDGCEEITGGA
jgi:hypothetical protein